MFLGQHEKLAALGIAVSQLLLVRADDVIQ